MKIRTLDRFLQEAADDRVWRIKEIALLKSICTASSLPEARRVVLRRAFIPIAYAHWEGYIKKIGQYYLDYVASQRLKLIELAPCFQSIYFSIENARELAMSRRHALQGVLRRLSEQGEHRVHIRSKGVISSQSNLNSETLEDICLNLGLGFDEFGEFVSFIDKILLGKRNIIAHGETIEVSLEELDEISAKVVTCIDIFRKSVENAASSGAFKSEVKTTAH